VNIAILTITDEWGGAEGHAVELARTIGQRGHCVTIVCLNERTYRLYNERSSRFVNLVALVMPKEWWRMNLFDWLRLFRGQTWNACLLVKGSFQVGGWALDFALRLLFANYVALEQLNAEPLPAKMSRRNRFVPSFWRYKIFFSGFLRSIFPRKIVCVSDIGRRRLIKDFAFPERKLSTVHNGINTEQFRRTQSYRKNWRQRWQIPPSALVFGAIGRLSQRKGYENALAGFQALLKAVPDKEFRFVLVGEGPHEQFLRNIASQVVPTGHVIFSPFCDRPWEPLSAIDIFLMPSLNEGLPFALLEAMACGCCPIASAVGGIPEIISSSDLGWLIPPDARSFTVAMIDAASRRVQELAAMSALAHKHVVKNFHAAKQFELLADAIESLSSPTTIAGENPIAPTH
jgi:glycosyltransferase involved in cell wall biosynthesis